MRGFRRPRLVAFAHQHHVAWRNVSRGGQPCVDAQRCLGLTNLAPKRGLLRSGWELSRLLAQAARFLCQPLCQRGGLLEAATPFHHDLLVVLIIDSGLLARTALPRANLSESRRLYFRLWECWVISTSSRL